MTKSLRQGGTLHLPPTRERPPGDQALATRVAALLLAFDCTCCCGRRPRPGTYNHQQYKGGALDGVVDVAGTNAFLEVPRTTVAVLGELLGDDRNRVTSYLSGRTPDGDSVVPGDLGTTQPPTGRDPRPTSRPSQMSTLVRALAGA